MMNHRFYGSAMRGGTGIVVAATILGLASCGITKPSGQNSNSRDANLVKTAEKASNLTSLERQAYTRNTLLKFSEAKIARLYKRYAK